MGKFVNKSDTFQDEIRLKLPKREESEMFAIVTIMTGAEYIKVLCEDGVDRAARIPGKMRHKVWIKENDVVIIRKWEYEDKKCDVVWRFMPLQVQKLRSQGHLSNLPI